jgi:hypothetical protein
MKESATTDVLFGVHPQRPTETGAPITYARQGKQYVVVAIAGMGHAPEWIALGL